MLIITIIIKNSWRYSSLEPRPIEAMVVQGSLWLAKRYPSTLSSLLLTGFHYFSYQVAIQLFSRGWVDPVPNPRTEYFDAPQ